MKIIKNIFIISQEQKFKLKIQANSKRNYIQIEQNSVNDKQTLNIKVFINRYHIHPE